MSLQRFVKSRSLVWKLVGSISVALVVTLGASYWIMELRQSAQAERAFEDKLRMLTDLSGGARLDSGQGSHPWEVTQRYAQGEGYIFRKPARSPLNPNDTADEFESRAFAALEKQTQPSQYTERARINGREMMRYARPVPVSQACQGCHTSWAVSDETHASESKLKTRHLDALFSVSAPVDTLTANQRSNAAATFLINTATLLMTSFTVYFLMRRLII